MNHGDHHGIPELRSEKSGFCGYYPSIKTNEVNCEFAPMEERKEEVKVESMWIGNERGLVELQRTTHTKRAKLYNQRNILCLEGISRCLNQNNSIISVKYEIWQGK
jgi:hypothetical protein